MSVVPGTVNLDPDGVDAYGSLAAPQADAEGPTLKWTRESPKKDGWYWFKEYGYTDIGVVEDGTVRFPHDVFLVEWVSGLWYGPLQEPPL